MSFFLFAVVSVVLVAALSRDYEAEPLRQVVATALLDLDDRALASLPARLHVSACSRGSLTHAERVGDATEALRDQGYQDLGSFAIDELPGTLVVLLLHPRDRAYAVVYDHAGAGVWLDVVSCYRDGSRWTHTTLSGHGHQARPGHTRIALPHATVHELVTRARSERPVEELSALTRTEIVARFEQGYAEWCEWRTHEAAADRFRPLQLVEPGAALVEDVRKAA